MDEGLLARHVDAIHAVGRDEFVAERDRRVRELRADGHREEATALKAQRKPTVPAWAVNQLARRQADTVEELIAAGGRLRTAQVRATSGKGADGLRPATRQVRDLAGDLASSARQVLEEAGASASHVAEVQQTLFAAAIDPEQQETLRRGVFTRPVEAAGFGAVPGLAAVSDDPPSPDPDEGTTSTDEAEDGPDPHAEALEQQRLREEEERARRDAHRRALEQQRGDLQQSLLRQQRRADRARVQADQLQARADEAAATAHDEEQAQQRIDRELADVEADLAALDDTDVPSEA